MPGTTGAVRNAYQPSILYRFGVTSPDGTRYTYYVSRSPSASDSNDGFTWSTAKATIAGALASAGTVPPYIRVGVGTFTITAPDAYGNGVTAPTAGTVIEGISPYLTRIEISCNVTWGVLLQAALSEIRKICVYPTPGKGAFTYGAGVDTPSPVGSAEGCKFTDVTSSGFNGSADWGFAVGPTHAGVGTVDIAQTIFTRCSSVGNKIGGYNVGNGTGGNILDTYFYGCNGQSNGSYGIYSAGTTWHWYGGTFQKNGYADIKLGNGSKLVSAQGFRSENSARLIVASGGGTCMVSLRDIIWEGGSGVVNPPVPSAGDVINYQLPGMLTLDNIQVQSGRGTGIAPCFILTSGSNHVLGVIASGLAAEAPINQLFSAPASQSVTVQVNSYIQMSNSTGYAVDGVNAVGPVTLRPSQNTHVFNGFARPVMQ